MDTRSTLPGLVVLMLVSSCSEQQKAPSPARSSLHADAAVAERLQKLAWAACECNRKDTGKQYQPNDGTAIDQPNQVPKCWQEFDRSLQPYRFFFGAAASAGMISPGEYLILPRESKSRGNSDNELREGEHYVNLNYAFGTCTPEAERKAQIEFETAIDTKSSTIPAIYHNFDKERLPWRHGGSAPAEIEKSNRSIGSPM